ncbi:PrgI family protein [Candidatus Gracilibacteria bacterium]|nr:PrgI family protein [Candidatus Gracilibacteria bacterium]
MQYKIPVQIENEDPIFLGLSLRQLTIIMIGFGVAYAIFQSLAPNVGGEIALIPSGFIAGITVAVAVFKYNEMTFVPFILSAIRLNIFPKLRKWENGTDSYQAIDVGFLSQEGLKKADDIDMKKKIDTMSELQEKLKKI